MALPSPLHHLDPSIAVRKLSRGNRQKVGVVATLMGHEPVLVLDEPTTGLDPQSRRQLWDVVLDMKASGRTVPALTPPGDTVGLTIENYVWVGSEPGRMAVSDDGSYLYVTGGYYDEGCGISEEFLHRHLFSPFRTSKKGGLGIGLIIVDFVQARGQPN